MSDFYSYDLILYRTRPCGKHTKLAIVLKGGNLVYTGKRIMPLKRFLRRVKAANLWLSSGFHKVEPQFFWYTNSFSGEEVIKVVPKRRHTRRSRRTNKA